MCKVRNHVRITPCKVRMLCKDHPVQSTNAMLGSPCSKYESHEGFNLFKVRMLCKDHPVQSTNAR